VLDALEADHEYLLRGEVFTPESSKWISFKREREVDAVASPHPYEFHLY